MSFPQGQFEKLLIRALHKSTPEDEARTAAIMARNCLEREGISSCDISITVNTTNGTSSNQDSIGTANAKLYADNKALRSALAQRERELEYASHLIRRHEAEALRQADCAKQQIDAMREANRSLRSQLKKQLRGRSKPSVKLSSADEYNEFVPFQDLRDFFRYRLKIDMCKTMLGLALGITMRDLNAWQRVGYFPMDLFRSLEGLDPEMLRPPSRRRWSDHDMKTLEFGLLMFDTDLDVAVFLTQSLGRRISETTVATRRRKIIK